MTRTRISLTLDSLVDFKNVIICLQIQKCDYQFPEIKLIVSNNVIIGLQRSHYECQIVQLSFKKNIISFIMYNYCIW